jgi:transposase
MFYPMEIARKPYPSDVSDDEWALIAPYLTLLPEDAGQREYPLREAFNGLRYIIKTGAQWRAMPHDLPPWAAVYQQARRWLAWGCFEALLDDLRAVLREALGRSAEPSAVIIDARTLRSSPESGERAGYDGGKRKKGSKLQIAVDTLGNLLALRVTPANVDERVEVGPLTRTVQAVTDNNVEVAFVEQG